MTCDIGKLGSSCSPDLPSSWLRLWHPFKQGKENRNFFCNYFIGKIGDDNSLLCFSILWTLPWGIWELLLQCKSKVLVDLNKTVYPYTSFKIKEHFLLELNHIQTWKVMFCKRIRFTTDGNKVCGVIIIFTLILGEKRCRIFSPFVT